MFVVQRVHQAPVSVPWGVCRVHAFWNPIGLQPEDTQLVCEDECSVPIHLQGALKMSEQVLLALSLSLFLTRSLTHSLSVSPSVSICPLSLCLSLSFSLILSFSNFFLIPSLSLSLLFSLSVSLALSFSLSLSCVLSPPNSRSLSGRDHLRHRRSGRRQGGRRPGGDCGTGAREDEVWRGHATISDTEEADSRGDRFRKH